MNRFLRHALLQTRSPYAAVLPYNLNWMLNPCDPLLSNPHWGPVVLVDVGCRGGLPDELWPLRAHLQQIGFDADPAECARLNAQPHDLHHRDVFPYFVGGHTGAAQFHLYRAPGASSSFPPNPVFARQFATDTFVIEKTIAVESTTLDDFFRGHPNLPRPDIIKLDTQGTELAILKAAADCLRTTVLVEVEVEFVSMYQGQPLFNEVMQYMNAAGFDLLYLNRVFQQRRSYPGIAKGQMTFGDALFARREDQCGALDEHQVARYLLLLINYGHLDFAYDLFSAHRFEDRTRALFEAHFRGQTDGHVLRLFKRASIPLLDKVLLLLLALKRHNALPNDSDRSWPIR